MTIFIPQTQKANPSKIESILKVSENFLNFQYISYRQKYAGDFAFCVCELFGLNFVFCLISISLLKEIKLFNFFYLINY